MTTAPHIVRGRQAERQALDYLQRQGLTLVRRNYRCRAGEIDLIMQDGATLVFVEVRSRGGAAARYGTPAESVTPAKQRRLTRAAAHYLLGRRDVPACRFDVVAISGAATAPDPARPLSADADDRRIDWIRDAFPAHG